MKPPLTTYFNQMIISGSFLFGGPLAALLIQAAAAPLGDRNANFEDISVHATLHLMRGFSFLPDLGRTACAVLLWCQAIMMNFLFNISSMNYIQTVWWEEATRAEKISEVQDLVTLSFT